MSIGCSVVNVQSNPCSVTSSNSNWKQTLVNERVILPDNLPDIKNLNSVKATLKITSSNIIQTPDSINVANMEGTYLTGLKLVVNGEIDQTIVYDSGENCKLYSFKHVEPFTTFIVLANGFNVNGNICLSGCVDGVLVKQVGCREIQKSIGVFIAVK